MKAVWKAAPTVARKVVQLAASTAETTVAVMVAKWVEMSGCCWAVWKADSLAERRAAPTAEMTADQWAALSVDQRVADWVEHWVEEKAGTREPTMVARWAVDLVEH